MGTNPALIGLLPMCISARLYNCARCHCQVTVCRHCDRGQVYCPGDCAQISRQESLQRARRLYQSSRRGRTTNAMRQQRHRQRLRQKVTHQGSSPANLDDLLPVKPDGHQAIDLRAHFGISTGIDCHFCRRQCGPFLRNHFLRPATPYRRPW